MKNKLLPAIIFLLLLFSIDLKSQDETKPVGEIYEIITTNGDKYEGYIKKMDDKNVIIDIVKAGQLTIKRKYIKSINKVKAISNGRKRFVQQNFASKNAFPLGKGGFYYSDIMLMFNNFGLGITDNITMGANLDFLDLFEFDFSEIGYGLSLKYSYQLPIKNVIIAGGAKYSGEHILNTYSSSDNYNSISLFGDLTFGDKYDNVTIGYKYPLTNSNKGFESLAVINLNGIFKVSKSTSLMFDCMLINPEKNEYGFIPMFGARTKIYGIYLDYGFFAVIGDSDFQTILPILSFKVPFIK